jgi:Zn-finger nucleic acid-binding protein
MWFSPQDLKTLEDEAFHLDQHAKGTLVFSSTETDLKCPECAERLKRFNYRLYDLEVELCEHGHGYWLDKDEDTRVLALMKKEERDIDRSFTAEEHWTTMVKHLHSGSFLDKVRELFR